MSPEPPRPLVLLGPIIGDMAGKPFEGKYNKTIPDPLFGPASRFSDDTILTCAVADGLVRGIREAGGRDGLAASAERQATVVNALARSIKDFGREYRHRGYGGRFRQWLESDSLEPYNSYGNGAVMRAGFAGWYATSTAEAELFGRLTARPTHNHPEAEEAAAALAACIHILKSGGDKKDALRHAQTRYNPKVDLREPGLRYLDVSVQAAARESSADAEKPALPLNIALVIDRSGSMSSSCSRGERRQDGRPVSKLEMVKRATLAILDRLTPAEAREGMSLSTFGVGLDFDELLMAGMAENGRGSYAFLERASEIGPALASEFLAAREAVVKDAHLTLTLDASVGIQRVFANLFEREGGEVRVSLGDMAAGEVRRALLRLEMPKLLSGTQVLGTAALRARLAAESGVELGESRELSVEYGAFSAAELEASLNPEIVERAAVFEARYARYDAAQARDEGRFDDARRMMGASMASMRAMPRRYRESAAMLAEMAESRVYADFVDTGEAASPEEVLLRQKRARAQRQNLKKGE